MSLVRDINRFLKDNRMSASRFGREACGDTAFVAMIRLGRVPGPDLEKRCRDYMAKAAEPELTRDRPTGQELAEELRIAAEKAGVDLPKFVLPLSTSNPHSWLATLRLAARPQLLTVQRIRALIDGHPIPEARQSPFAGHVWSRGRDRSGEHLESKFQREAKQAMGAKAHVERRPGETLAQCLKRIADEADAEEQADALSDAERKRERELNELETPGALIRRAQRDWPQQNATVAALAAELGVQRGEVWRRVIVAGIEALAGGAG